MPDFHLPARRLPLPGMSANNIGSDYTDEEAEMLRAVASWRQQNGRSPTVTELMEIARSIGWRKASA